MSNRTYIKILFLATCLFLVSCQKDNNREELKTVYYQDSDGDGFGNAAIEIEETIVPAGYVENNLDCNDSVKEINPDATEVFNNTIDENCDGEIAEKESYGGDVILLTQEDVDNFGRHNYKTIYGKLQIGTENEPNTSIVSLEPLRALRVVRQ